MALEITEQDTMRWGGSQTYAIPAGDGSETVQFTKQLLAAHWHWPLSWNFFMAISPMIDPTELATFTLDVTFAIGVGQGIDTFVKQYSIAPIIVGPPSTYPTVVIDQFLLPAQDLQTTAVISGTPVGNNGSQIKVAHWIAPQTEPHVMMRMLKQLRGEYDTPHEWMPPGFTPHELKYR